MVKALIHGTRICELVDDDKTFEVHPDLKWVDIANGTTTNDTYVDSKVVKYVESVPTWDENRRRSYPVIGDQLHAPNTPNTCLLYTSPSPRDGLLSRMPSSA